MSWLDEVDPEINVVIIHPNYKANRLLLGVLFVDPVTCCYVSFTGANLDLPELKQQFHDKSSVGQLKEDPNYIVLDECDRSQAHALRSLVIWLLGEFSSRIIIASRSIPEDLTKDVGSPIKVAIYPVGSWHLVSNYQPNVQRPVLAVQGFGRGRAFINGKEIVDWGGEVTRQLFFFLVDSPIITRAMIFEEFWPDLSIAAATNVFHVTKYNVSKTLGFELFRYSAGFYRLSNEIDLIYDVNEYHRAAQSGSIKVDQILLEEAIANYHGDFLEGATMQWVIGRREELRLSFSEILSLQAENYRAKGDLDRALQLYLRALYVQLGREDVTEHLMNLYLKQNDSMHALQVFYRTKNFLNAVHNLEPSSRLRALAQQAKQIQENLGRTT